MRYLGGLRGAGDLTRGSETLGRADYDFDGFLAKAGKVMCCGEIRANPELLRDAFGRRDVGLRTDDGRLLSLHFSERQMQGPADCAHVDVGGDLPPAIEWGNGSKPGH